MVMNPLDRGYRNPHARRDVAKRKKTPKPDAKPVGIKWRKIAEEIDTARAIKLGVNPDTIRSLLYARSHT